MTANSVYADYQRRISWNERDVSYFIHLCILQPYDIIWKCNVI